MNCLFFSSWNSSETQNTTNVFFWTISSWILLKHTVNHSCGAVPSKTNKPCSALFCFALLRIAALCLWRRAVLGVLLKRTVISFLNTRAVLKHTVWGSSVFQKRTPERFLGFLGFLRRVSEWEALFCLLCSILLLSSLNNRTAEQQNSSQKVSFFICFCYDVQAVTNSITW